MEKKEKEYEVNNRIQAAASYGFRENLGRLKFPGIVKKIPLPALFNRQGNNLG
jgi:hypothetical protein